MRKLIIGLFSSLSLVAWAQIQVQVEPSQIAQGETFQLTLTQDNVQDTSLPNLNILQKDFILVGTARQVNYSVINGQAQSSRQWVLSLQAKKPGILTIPSIKLGSEQSSPVTINVTKSAAANNQNDLVDASSEEDVFIVGAASEAKPYVNQQVIYTVKLFNRKRLIDADYQGPQVEDALLIPLGDGRRYQTTKNNQEYMVEEQNYAVFPQKSGALKIKSPVFSALVYDFNPQRINVHDEPTKLKVQPIPVDYKGKIWLPAQKITLTERYENSKQTFAQGETLVRTVGIEGVAVPGQLLPTLQFDENKQLNVYPEREREQNIVRQGVLVGSVATKVTYLFKEPGKLTIPELRLSWFNTNTGKEEFASLPPRTIEITSTNVTGTENKDQSKQSSMSVLSKMSQNHTVNPQAPATNKGPWVIAGMFAFLWLLTLGLWGFRGRKKPSNIGQYKKALNALNQACIKNDPIKTRDALLHWAALHWPDTPLLNLTDISKLVRDIHIQNQLHQLSQVLYKNEEKTNWNGNELAKSIQAFIKVKSKKKQNQQDSLPPINKI